jgi:hypothetical protein
VRAGGKGVSMWVSEGRSRWVREGDVKKACGWEGLWTVCVGGGSGGRACADGGGEGSVS